VSLHKYLYANQNPLTVIDPTGLFGGLSIGGFAAAGAIIGAMSAVAIVQPRGVLETVETVVYGAAIGAALGAALGWWALGGSLAGAAGTAGATGAAAIPIVQAQAIRLPQSGTERIWLGHYGGQGFNWLGQRIIPAGEAGLTWLKLAAERYGGKVLNELPRSAELIKREIDAAQQIVFNISRLYQYAPSGQTTLTYIEYQYIMSRPDLIQKTIWVTGATF
jgi:hypothetical protein